MCCISLLLSNDRKDNLELYWLNYTFKVEKFSQTVFSQLSDYLPAVVNVSNPLYPRCYFSLSDAGSQLHGQVSFIVKDTWPFSTMGTPWAV